MTARDLVPASGRPRVLVTGATGFLGAHLLPRLAETHDVTALVRRPTELGVETVLGDVLDPESLRRAAAGCEAVVHAAGGVDHRPEAGEAMHAVHVTGTANVLAAAKAAGVRRFVHLSSSGTVHVSAEPGVTGTEDSPSPLGVVQTWPYYRAKVFAEQQALAANAEGFEVVVLNPGLLLGPGDRRGESTRAVSAFLDGDVLAAPPGGICFVDVRDVADGVALSLRRGAAGRRTLLTAGNWTFAEFYERLARVAGMDPPRLTLPRLLRAALAWAPRFDPTTVKLPRGWSWGDIARHDLELACHTWWCDSARARRELGWIPRDPMQTLMDTVFDLRARAEPPLLDAPFPQPRA